ncbi:protein grindelwald isoform X2 [Tenebrio molitor]|uniref:protein grindelwald isoform X2 n=1 Tax=Tenebrio molitor TaxID=7067 RepID=UPI00362471AF
MIHTECDIQLEGTACGQKICKRDEYCSQYHRSCESCSKICDNSTHNYDSKQCVKDCQDYLHDSLYVLKGGITNGDDNLRATVQRLSHMVTVTLTLVCFMLIILAIVLSIQLYRWKKKKNITFDTIKNKIFAKKSESAPNKCASAPNQTNIEKPDLRLEIPTESTHSGNSPVTVTTSISRRPAEDDTQDYAYDNPAMSGSPNNKSSPNAF